VGNIDYDTLGDFEVDLLQLVRMPTWITLYWKKKVSAKRMNGIRFFSFFSKDEAKHEPCKNTYIKVMLLFLHVFWGNEISRMKCL
jgi:hypothetical protein